MHRPLVRLLLAVGVVAVSTGAVSLAWTAIGGGALGVHGVVALSLGIGGTAALAWALMSLAFRSSREGWDDQSADPAESDKP